MDRKWVLRLVDLNWMDSELVALKIGTALM